MKIGNISLVSIQQDELQIKKSLKLKTLSILYSIALYAVILVGWKLITKGQKIKLPDNKFEIAGLFLLLVLFGIFLLFELRRTIRVISDFTIKKNEDRVYVNGRYLCDAGSVKYVFRQPITGWQGFGRTYTVGISSLTGHTSLVFNLTDKDSQAIAEELAAFLRCSTSVNKKKIFTLYRGY
jgi:hypothetical protein